MGDRSGAAGAGIETGRGRSKDDRAPHAGFRPADLQHGTAAPLRGFGSEGSGLLREARDKGALVVHSLAPGAAASSILPDLAPREGEPVVASGPDKFLGTDLERILADKGIRKVIVVGTAAHGAVLHTASAAALRGLDVVAPVDGMSAEEAYPEQYTAWHLANAPRIGERVTLTSIDRVRY